MQKKSRTQKRKRPSQSGVFSNARGLVAMGTIAAYAAMGANRPAMAAIWKVDPNGNGTSATLPLKRFDIPAGPLDGAIAAFEKTTGLNVKIVLPSGTLEGFNSNGVVGLYREDEALGLAA